MAPRTRLAVGTIRSKNTNELLVPEVEQQASYYKPNVIVNPFVFLPDELILIIFEELLYEPRRCIPPFPFAFADSQCRVDSKCVPHSTFAALALTCRSFYPLAMRYLYSVHTADEPAVPFLKIICGRPNLAKFVKRIDFGPLPDLSGKGLNKTIIETYVSQLALPFKEEWRETLDVCSADIALALMVYHCRNVEVLTIPSTLALDPILDCLQHLPSPLAQQHDYSKLRDLEITLRSGMCLHQVANIMLLPSLTSLSLKSLRKYAKQEPPWPLPANVSAVQNIYFLYSDIPALPLAGMLESCQSLKSFQYLMGETPSEKIQWYATITTALERHRDTLENISIAERELGSDPQESVSWGHQPCQAFERMISLIKLEIDFNVLMGKCGDHTSCTLQDLLPPQLRYLELVLASSTLVPHIDYNRLLQALPSLNSESASGNLRDLTIKYAHDVYEAEFPIRFYSLWERCLEYDIKLKLWIECKVENKGMVRPSGYRMITCGLKLTEPDDFDNMLDRMIAMGQNEALVIANNFTVDDWVYPDDILDVVKDVFDLNDDEDWDIGPEPYEVEYS